jgi:hypothetical protein
MRHTHIALLTLGTCLTLAAGPKDVTYLAGSLEGITSKATLDLTNTKVMVLRSGSIKIEIPYMAISKSDVKTQEFAEKEPLYKVWTLGSRLMPPTPQEEYSLEYRDAKGATTTVTLGMEKSVADKLSARLAKAEERKAAQRGDWWGDSYWKTKRNQNEWGGAGELASRE